jgi:hypothetical protein
VLYHRLAHDRSQGVYDRKRFLEYLKLPRAAYLTRAEYLEDARRRSHQAELSAVFAGTGLGAVGSDEAMVRDYLENLLAAAKDWSDYAPYVREGYLKMVFAEAKILFGQDDPERWCSLFGTECYAVLRERVDLNFLPTNRMNFRADEEVRLDLAVKNVPKLVVKVYEINALNWCRENLVEVPQDIDLNGLVAGEEKVHELSGSPFLRARRSFELPGLKKPGVYAVEFVGGGKRARALVRKGQLRCAERLTTAGHLFTVFDEDGAAVKDARLWLAGREHLPREDGTILVPFTNEPGQRTVVLSRGELVSLDRFRHCAEAYKLDAGLHVDRESLIGGKAAKILIRPTLLLNGAPVTLSRLESAFPNAPALAVTVRDRSGATTTLRLPVELREDREAVCEFPVPVDLENVQLTLTAAVKRLSDSGVVELSATDSLPVNMTEQAIATCAPHLVREDGRWTLWLLGRNGEPRADHPLRLSLAHRDFIDPVETVLQTDARGRVDLGLLDGVLHFSATTAEGRTLQFSPAAPDVSLPEVVNLRAGEALRLPWPGESRRAERSELALLELRGGLNVRDCFESLSVEGGMLVVGQLAPGTYELVLKRHGTVTLCVADAAPAGGRLVSRTRLLELQPRPGLQIASADVGRDEIKVRLLGASRFARLHAVATHFAPGQPRAFRRLAGPGRLAPEVRECALPESAYAWDLAVDSEYRYVLERRYAAKYPGNMLDRPGLLLNPWALRDTESVAGSVGIGGGGMAGTFGYRDGGGRKKAVSRHGGITANESDPDAFASLEFLAEPAAVLDNLRPDKDGVVTVPRKAIGGRRHVQLIAVDPEGAAFRLLALPGGDVPRRDLRMVSALAPDRRYVRNKRVAALRAGQTLTAESAGAGRLAIYDTVGKVYELYLALARAGADGALAERVDASFGQLPGKGDLAKLENFRFVTGWEALERWQKLDLYSEHACHELHFFLYMKDRPFFNEVVSPYLANKKDKTYFDQWLLGLALEAWRQPWAHGRLNAAERVLLGRRVAAEREPAARAEREAVELLPPAPEWQDLLFGSAIAAAAMREDEVVITTEVARPAIVQEVLKHNIVVYGEGRSAGEGKSSAAISDIPAEEYYEAEVEFRSAYRPAFRDLGPTREWAESNYLGVTAAQESPGLVPAGRFWSDCADAAGDGPVLSEHFAEASHGFTEMMLALAFLDLPFKAPAHNIERGAGRATFSAAGNALVLCEELREVAGDAAGAQVLVGQDYFVPAEREELVDGEKVEKYVTGAMLAGTVYGCQVVVTNPAARRQSLDLLIEVPSGAIPVAGAFASRSLRLEIEPHATRAVEYQFYFPEAGRFGHCPAQLSCRGRSAAAARSRPLEVLDRPAGPDRASWECVSQLGSGEDVLAFLGAHNVRALDLDRIAWRLRDREFFRKVTALLAARGVYRHKLWSYALLHDEKEAAGEYLRHADAFVAQCGAYLASPLLVVDPVERRSYQHLEYWPLVNPRTHAMDGRRVIGNGRVLGQYRQLLDVLACRDRLDDDDRLSAVYHLLLQDRVEEALAQFGQIDAARLETRLQYDYCQAYLAFFAQSPAPARKVAEAYRDYPVLRWRNLFLEVLAQLDELEGKAPAVIDEKSRGQVQTGLAGTEPVLEMTMDGPRVRLTCANLAGCRVSYYPMDLELLFSRRPFVRRHEGQFTFVRPAATEELLLPAGGRHDFEIPERWRNSNVMVEVTAAGKRRCEAYCSHSMELQLIEGYGQLRLSAAEDGKPLAKAYVKVYARLKGGSEVFHKDGYTDLRGRFDYASVSGRSVSEVERFAVLVQSEANGALVTEAAPPGR